MVSMQHRIWKIIARVKGLDGKWFYRAILLENEGYPHTLAWDRAETVFTTDGSAKIDWSVGQYSDVKSAQGALGALVRGLRKKDASASVEQGVCRFEIDLAAKTVRANAIRG